jgi:hypothetical protein
MVAPRRAGRNFRPGGRVTDTAAIVDPPPAAPSFALTLRGLTYALEPGRRYTIGSRATCDLRLPGAVPHHADVWVEGDEVHFVERGTTNGTAVNGVRRTAGTLRTGDRVRLGRGEFVVVPDRGNAAVVPVPELRLAASLRRAEQAIAQRAERQAGDSFRDLMAAELRRSPWFAASLLLHALLALLLWLWFGQASPLGSPQANYGFDPRPEAATEVDATALPDVVAERAEDSAPEPAPAFEEPADPPPTAGASPPKLPSTNERIAPRKQKTTAQQGGGGGTGSGAFQRTVGELRQTGLEVMFVVDATSSMTPTIEATRATLGQMLAALRVLVPDARFGVVAYRDRGPREEFVVRELPLGRDFYRASNFVHHITAAGGGNRPEDVRAGLLAAFQQHWQPNARRVVVLTGDAPPHAEDFDRLLREVRAFVKDGRSFVHTLVVSPQRAGADTTRAFQSIADHGRGSCEGLDRSDQTLQQVLTLAFGAEFAKDIQAILATVEAEQSRVDSRSLHLARQGGAYLQDELRLDPVPTTICNALVRRPRRLTAEQLVDALGRRDTPAHTRQAIAAVLHHVLELSAPPIDPMGDVPPGPAVLDHLRGRLFRVPE